MAIKNTWDINLPSCEAFLEKYGIESEELAESKLAWDDLRAIHKDYCEWKEALDKAKCLLQNRLSATDEVPIHAVSTRIKEPEKVIGKIIRKSAAEGRPVAGLENYRTAFQDFIGARALHLFKEDWLAIHEFLMNEWDVKGNPCANICEEDPSYLENLYKREGCSIEYNLAGYRSIHYAVRIPMEKDIIYAEIQVRTLFEEAWVEISHKVEYPYSTEDVLLKRYTIILSHLAGQADTAASIIDKLYEINCIQEKSKGKEERIEEITQEFLIWSEHLDSRDKSLANLLLDFGSIKPDKLRELIDDK